MATLFGPSPAEILFARQKEQEQMDMLRQQQIGQQGSQFGVFAPLYQAGLQFGDIGASAMRQGLFPQQADPSLQKATAIQGVLSKYAGQDTNSASVLEKISADLRTIDPDASFRALELADKRKKEPKETFRTLTEAEKKEQGITDTGVYQIGSLGGIKRVAEPKDESPLTIADRARLTQLQRQFGEEAGAVRFRQERDEVARKTAAAGREPGDLKITDVAAGTKIVEDIVGSDRKRLETVGLLKTQIADIRKGNSVSVPQLQRGLVKAIGDSQIGQNEVNQVLGASGFPQGIIEGMNKFFTGLPTDLKIDQVEQAVEAIEDYYANRFNQGLGRASSLLSDTRLPKTTVEKMVGSSYTSAVEKRNKNLIASFKAQDRQAYDWAKSNPNDPRSAEIIKKLGVR